MLVIASKELKWKSEKNIFFKTLYLEKRNYVEDKFRVIKIISAVLEVMIHFLEAYKNPLTRHLQPKSLYFFKKDTENNCRNKKSFL